MDRWLNMFCARDLNWELRCIQGICRIAWERSLVQCGTSSFSVHMKGVEFLRRHSQLPNVRYEPSCRTYCPSLSNFVENGTYLQHFHFDGYVERFHTVASLLRTSHIVSHLVILLTLVTRLKEYHGKMICCVLTLHGDLVRFSKTEMLVHRHHITLKWVLH